MDDCQPGRGDLTAQQRQQRCDWARAMWAAPSTDPAWRQLFDCTVSLIDQGLYESGQFIKMFKAPEEHPVVLDALFEEYAKRKLLGEAP